MFGNKKEVTRQAKYQYLCAANSMQYLGEDSFGVKSLLKYFELFKGKRGKIRNLSQMKLSTMEEEIHLFDFKYTINTGKSSHSFDQTVFFVNSKSLRLPEFRMKPESIGNKIAAYFGWEDIDFGTYPAFSDKYHLSGEHEDFIRHTFDDKILKFFSKTSGWTIEAANYYLIFYAHSSLVPENILPDFFRLGMGVYDLFKGDAE